MMNPRMLIGSVAAIVALAIGLLFWQPWTRGVAAPGKMPEAAPAGDQVTAAPDLEGGAVVPRLTAADTEKLQRGESVEMQVGGGSIVIGPPPKGGTSP